MSDRTQEIKNLRAVATACKNYTDKVADNLRWELGTYDLGVDSDTDVSRIKSLPSNTIKSMVDYIGGKSVKYNQFLINNESTVTRNGITFTNNGNGTWTVNGTSTARANTAVNIPTFKIPAKLNDKIFIIGCPSGGSVLTYYLAPVFCNDGSYVTFDINNADVGNGKIVTVTNSNVNEARIEIIGAQSENQTVNNLLFKPELINLTDIFGAGNEPSTVETAIPLLKANGYKLDGTDTYSTGSLKHAITTSVKYLPINVWDEEWELGSIESNGQPSVSTTKIRSKNFNECYPNTTYYFYVANPQEPYVFWYDENYNFISFDFMPNRTKTSPNNAHYFKIRENGTTYNNSICINISNASYNGNYYPYVAPITKAIPNEVLADARYGLGFDNTNYNHLDIDGHLRGNWGIVDLGSLDWEYVTTSGTNPFFSTQLIGILLEQTRKVLCAIYDIYNLWTYGGTFSNDAPNMSLGARREMSYIYIRDDRYTTVEQFKTAMSGVYLVYELATAFDQDYSQYFDTNWNKVDLDKLYATCEMAVAEPIDMPNSITNLIEEVKA